MKYLFDPDVLHDCALKGVGLPKPQMFEAVEKAMEEAYPGLIHRDQPWIYSIAGGVMIQMKVCFASLMEYVILWGTPIGSEGHSGRHLAGFWDTVLEGEAWYYAEGQFEKRIYRPGDRIYVGPGQARGMNFTDGIWALEYARGFIPYSIPFGLADIMVSTLDWPTALQTLGVYMDLTGRYWSRDKLAPAWLRPLKAAAGFASKVIGARLTRLSTPSAPYDDIPDNQGRRRPLEEINTTKHTTKRPTRLRTSEINSPEKTAQA